MREFQQYLEHLVNTRFNFFLLFVAVVVGASMSSDSPSGTVLILIIGALVSVPVALTIARAQLKLDLAFARVLEDENDPARIINDEARGRFPPSMGKWIGYWIPLFCVGLLVVGAIAAGLSIAMGVTLPRGANSGSTGAPAESSITMQGSIPSLIPAVATLVGVLAGSLLTYVVQSNFHRRDRKERCSERIREAYANWAGSILEEVDACRRQLSFRESAQQVSTVGVPEAISLHMVESMKEMTLAALDATHREQVAFARLQLTDLEKERRQEAHEIRLPVKESLTDSQEDVRYSISTFEAIERTFADRLSKFLASIAKSLDRK